MPPEPFLEIMVAASLIEMRIPAFLVAVDTPASSGWHCRPGAWPRNDRRTAGRVNEDPAGPR
ncbi:hypothetical protein JOD64_005456 [Micromonospora luteifusca]|uniref:Uncharacterized protein n=1 Tax=Micromonospora luteifusca TaxID=709860 RepID=A0ABS2M1B1_9ACTN|nr:hypothetical protein [Micromonospora luteifusca]